MPTWFSSINISKFLLIPIFVEYLFSIVKNGRSLPDVVGLGLIWLYGISTFVGYLIPNHFYTHILNIYNLVLLGFMPYQTV